MVEKIVAPLMGGLIGYITNDLAIKMLFHPRKSVYIGKWHVPFTPGLIPSQKERIAGSLGRVISDKLLSGEAIRAVALSDETLASLRSGVESWLMENAGQTATLRELLGRVVPDEKLDAYAEKISEGVSDAAVKELEKRDAGKKISNMLLDALCQGLQGTMLMTMMSNNGLISRLEMQLSNAINEVIRAHGPALLKTEIAGMEQELLDQRVCDLTGSYTDKVSALADILTDLYRRVLMYHLDSLLQMANIGAIVEKKINSFSAGELEALIFGLMKRELKAIVYIGAVLGFLMGFVNLLL